MRFRRIASVLLVLCLVFNSVIPGVSAAETKDKVEIVDSGDCSALGKENNVMWTLDSSGVLTISGTGEMKDYIHGWRKYRDDISKVIIEDGVTSIGKNAFFQCEYLESVKLPKSIESIGSYAFSLCLNLKKLEIPEGVTRIENNTFAACKQLKSVNVPKTVKNIGDHAFLECAALYSIRISDNFEKIGTGAFERSGLRYVFFDGEAPEIDETAFRSVNSVMLYDSTLQSWTDENKQNYSGTLSWEEIKPLEITSAPKNGYAKLNGTVSVTMQASGNAVSYEWYYKDVGFPKFKRSKLCFGNTYQVQLNKYRNRRQICCIVRDVHGNEIQTEKVLLRTAATITQHPKDVKVKNGKTAKVTLKAVGDELAYAWYHRKPGASTFTKASSFTNAVYSETMTKELNGTQVYCVVTDKYGKTDISKTVTLKMK